MLASGRKRAIGQTRKSLASNGFSIGWHEVWVLTLLAGLLVVMTVYYDEHALDTSFIPRLRGFYATLLAALPLLMLPTTARRLNMDVLKDPLVLSFGLFSLICFGSLGLGLNPTAGLTDAFRSFATWVWLCLLCLLVPTMPRWRELLLQIIVCGAALSVCWGYYETLTILGPGLHSRDDMTNVVATMANVNLYAGFLVLVIPFTLCAMVVLKGWWRLGSGLVALAGVAMVALLQTRAAYLGLAGSICLGVLLSVPFAKVLGIRPLARRAIAGAVVISAVVFAALLVLAPESNPLASRVRSIGDIAEDRSTGARLMTWKITLQMIADYFPWGVGTGNFTMRFHEYFNEQTDFRSEGTNWLYPHNDYLWILVEQGLPGALAFGAIFLLALTYCLIVLLRTDSKQDGWLALAVIMGITAYLIDSVFGFPLARVSHQIYVSTALACAVLLYRDTSGKMQLSAKPAGARYPRKLLLAVVPVLAVLIVGFAYTRAAMKQEFYLANVFALEEDGMWLEALRVVRASYTPWKTTDPFATPIAYHEARVLKEIGTPWQVLEALERAYEVNPNRIHVINDLGAYYAKTGQLDKAVALLTKTVERYPHQIACVENLALCHMDRNEYAKALEVLERIPVNSYTDSILEKIARCRKELAAPSADRGGL
jgi:O-antigen ligase